MDIFCAMKIQVECRTASGCVLAWSRVIWWFIHWSIKIVWRLDRLANRYLSDNQL